MRPPKLIDWWWSGSQRPPRCRSSIGNRSEPFTFRGDPCSNFAATSSLDVLFAMGLWAAGIAHWVGGNVDFVLAGSIRDDGPLPELAVEHA